MKKAYIYLTFIVMAVLGTAACSKSSQLDPTDGNDAQESKIGFGSVTAKRADELTPDAAKPLQLAVYDYYTAEGAEETEYIDELIQESETEGAWVFVKEGEKNSYSWKKGAHQFFGWVAVDESGTEVPGLSYDDKTLSVGTTASPVAAEDYRYSEIATVNWPDDNLFETVDGKKTVKPVTLKVKHLTSALTYKVTNNTETTVTVNSVKVVGIKTTASATVDYAAETLQPAISLGATGTLALVDGKETCVWPQEVSGAELTVNYTSGTTTDEVTVEIPDVTWVAGNVYNFNIEVVAKGLELTFTVAQWEEVTMDLDTSDGSINMSNVTWMNTKVTVDGVETNTVNNAAYSVTMWPNTGTYDYFDGEEVKTVSYSYQPAQGYFTVNYPEEGLYKIGLIPAYGETTVDPSQYKILIYDSETTSWRDIDADGEEITHDTVYFRIIAVEPRTSTTQQKAQIDIWFKPKGSDEWISAYSEIRANYAITIPATS